MTRHSRRAVASTGRLCASGLGGAPSRIPHEPSDQADSCQTENPVLQQAPRLQRTSFGGVGQRAINIRSRSRGRRAGPSPPFGHGYPPRDRGKHFGRAYRALLGVMNFLAVQTQSSGSKLHVSVYPTSRAKAPRNVRTMGRTGCRRRNISDCKEVPREHQRWCDWLRRSGPSSRA